MVIITKETQISVCKWFKSFTKQAKPSLELSVIVAHFTNLGKIWNAVLETCVISAVMLFFTPVEQSTVDFFCM